MKFKYGDAIIVTEGFYKGLRGRTISFNGYRLEHEDYGVELFTNPVGIMTPVEKIYKNLYGDWLKKVEPIKTGINSDNLPL